MEGDSSVPAVGDINKDSALDAAVDEFWSRGYAATTMTSLSGAMGVSSARIYSAFGDKKALFARCLERYMDTSMRARIAVCEMLPPREALVAFFAGIVTRSMEDRRGCLMVNSMVELAAHDDVIAELINARLAELEGFFTRCIRRGQRDRSIATQRNAADIARLMVASVLGLRVMALSRPDADLFHGVVRQALGLLDIADG